LDLAYISNICYPIRVDCQPFENQAAKISLNSLILLRPPFQYIPGIQAVHDWSVVGSLAITYGVFALAFCYKVQSNKHHSLSPSDLAKHKLVGFRSFRMSCSLFYSLVEINTRSKY
jgi:hypothetical protein